jgi:hypothetical protein
MTAAELDDLQLAVVKAVLYSHEPLDPILARALADERNRALEEAVSVCLTQYGSSVERYRTACKDCAERIAALKTDPAESGR